ERSRLVLEDRAQQLALAQLAADAVGSLREARRERARYLLGIGSQFPGGLDEKALAIGEHDEADARSAGESLQLLLEGAIGRRRRRGRGGRGRRRSCGRCSWSHHHRLLRAVGLPGKQTLSPPHQVV